MIIQDNANMTMERRTPIYRNSAVPGYNGPLARLVRSGDNMTFDVYPATLLNTVALLAFALGRTVSLGAYFDQKGTEQTLTTGPVAANLSFSLGGLLGISIGII